MITKVVLLVWLQHYLSIIAWSYSYDKSNHNDELTKERSRLSASGKDTQSPRHDEGTNLRYGIILLQVTERDGTGGPTTTHAFPIKVLMPANRTTYQWLVVGIAE